MSHPQVPEVQISTLNTLGWVGDVADACIQALGYDEPFPRWRFCNTVAECVYRSIDEVAKANLAARQTMVALWPAIISFIAALYPDAGDVAFENMFCAVVIAATSSGISGNALHTTSAYHTTNDAVEAENLCSGISDFESTLPLKTILSQAVPTHTIGAYVIVFISLVLYGAFLGIFFTTLKRTVLTWLCSPYWFGSIWYFLATLPSAFQAVHTLRTQTVTLYEMQRKEKRSTVEQHQNRQPTFTKVTSPNQLYLWLRISKNQFLGSPYRLLIRKRAPEVVDKFVEVFIALCRTGVFIVGSVTNTSLIIMPTPWDSVCFVLIVLATLVPRVLWTSFHPHHRLTRIVIDKSS